MGLLPACKKPLPNADWPLHGLDYAGSRHSTLAQINRDNIGQLQLAWRINTGKKGSFQTAPVVVDGVMYISTPFNDVIALNATDGKEIWRYRHQLRFEDVCCGPANRGVAVANGMVYMAAIDNRLIALDQKTGTVRWDIDITNNDPGVREAVAPILGEDVFKDAKVTGGTGYSANMAPQVFEGKVFVGITGTGYGLHLDLKDHGDAALSVVGFSGGDNGLRGFLAAYDAVTGKELWRWYSVPDESWVGSWRADTPDGVPLHRDLDAEKAGADKWRNAWRLGGGSIWTTPAIDTESHTLFIGTGNPAPQMDDQTRPGDNQNTSSVVALDTNTGKLKWAYQIVPHDRWGYDAATPPLLVTAKRDGVEVPAVAAAGKTGWVYVLDRNTGALLYKSEPFVPQRNLFSRPTSEGVEITPAILGGGQWSPSAYDQQRQTYFIEGVHHPATYYSKPLTPSPGKPWTSYTYMELSKTERGGTLTAIDIANGHIRWQQKTEHPMLGGLVVTDGGLLFAGEGDQGFSAFDADTGKRLWNYQTDAGVNAPPITYSIDGRQYVAVAAGGNSLFNFKTGDAFLVFALPAQAN